ncbi:MAG: amidase [Candidatus Korobacteraceae bacterium]|jgi:aspartyl-tRNA(Asn)/glutamyl-tRNA(Gln) amidotransferase subunit A
MQTSLTRLTLAAAAEQLKQRQISPVELTKACLSQIEQYNPVLNAFITVTAESALSQAAEAECEIQSGHWRGPLHGIPVGLKDLIDQKDVPTTAGSAVLKDTIAVEDAEVTRRLRQAGAVLIGKLNLHEFAYGGSGIISHFGPVCNPWDTTRITGGSSSGSAAAVATGMCFAALGTDTAGSIRLPAAYCGIVGLKPSFGLVSRRGVFPLALSFDHVGPMTRTVEDAAMVLDVIAGYDPADPADRPFSQSSYPVALRRDTAGLRVGIATEYFGEGVEPEIESHLRIAVAQIMDSRPSSISEVKVPIDEDRTVHIYEAYQYHEQFLEEYRDQYDPQTLARILQGKDVSEEQYHAARCNLDALRRRSAEIFRNVDVLITPTVPISPPTIADLQSGLPELRKRELIMLRNTRPFNVLGLPSITLPCGFTADGLPVGMQISAAPGAERKVLAIAHQFEQRTEWHHRLPRVLES